jgi:hypothetical protein
MHNFENLRLRQGLGSADSRPERGLALGILISVAVPMITVIGFIYWLGSMSFWR